MKRSVIHIDDEKCDGCGLCIPNCPEGAIQIIDGKARLVSDLFCDGLGACLGHCPQGAISIEEREAGPYDESKVMENVVKGGEGVIKAHLKHLKEHGQQEYLNQALAFLGRSGTAAPVIEEEHAHAGHSAGCPGGRTMDFRQDAGCPGSKIVDSRDEGAGPRAYPRSAGASELRQWPVQLQLVSPDAPYFDDADLVIAADCVPFAYPDFHRRFLKDKTLIIFCPKLDKMPDEYVEKLAEIFKRNSVRSVTVVHMEVPCCFGLRRMVEEAVEKSGRAIKIREHTISIRGALV